MSLENPDNKNEEASPGAEFLKKKYSDLKKSEQVDLNYQDSKKEKEEQIESWLNDPEELYTYLTQEHSGNQTEDRVDIWLKNAEAFHKRHHDEEAMSIIREAFHKEYIIKPEDVPESYFENQKRLAREQGHGDIEITDEVKNQGIDIIIRDQQATLDNWVDYLLSEDADAYPMWAKYWALRSMTKLSSYDKEKKAFGNRRKDTVAPFPDLNREALSFVVDLIIKKANKEDIEIKDHNPELEKLLQSENFGQFYAYAIEKVTPTEKNELETIEGEWIKYDQGSDHMPLVESLQGHATGWCTAGESTAETQLSNGDFYVYYSQDKEGNNTIPRVAIRMQGNEIGEVRGIGPDQNFDPYIGEVANQKLQEFPDHEKYQKKTADMKLLTLIEAKQNRNEELTKEELRFLYELDSKIEGFGYQSDPRIEEVISKRDIKGDISSVTGFSKEEISITKKEALTGNKKFHLDNLYLNSLESAKGLKLPETINGDLNLNSLESAEGLTLPETLNGSLNLGSLQSAEGLTLPETINGNLWLSNLQSAEGLKLPETINGSLNLNGLQSAEGLKLPETINGSLNLFSLQSAEGLTLPETINGSLNLFNLKSAKGLKLPKTLNSNLDLSSLQSAEGLKLPETINGDLYLNKLQSAEGLKLPETINGDLHLSSLQSAEGLNLPKTIKGNFHHYNFKTTEIQ